MNILKGREAYIDQVSSLSSSYLPIISSLGSQNDYGSDIQVYHRFPLERWKRKPEPNASGQMGCC